MFSRLVSDVLVLCTNVPDSYSIEFISLMSTIANVAIGAGGVLREPPLYFLDKNVLRNVLRLDVCRFAMMPVGQALTAKVDNEKREMAYEGWPRR